MGKEKLDAVACRHRFWRLLGKHAPHVREDLFDRDRPRIWNIKEWDARKMRLDPLNPRGNAPHPAALEWVDKWGLPDWCLLRAEHALDAKPSRQLKTLRIQDMDRWRKSVSHSIYYYLKPPPFEFKLSLWPRGSAYEYLTREECRERILAEAAKKADEYFDKHVATFNWFGRPERSEHRKFDEHCQWLILNRFCGQTQAQIADQASQGRKRPYTDEAISKAIVALAKRLDFPNAAP